MNRYSFTKSPERGFTMVEVLIAFVVVTVGLLAIGVLQSGIIGTSSESKARTEALSLAEGQLERYRADYYAGEGRQAWCEDVAGRVQRGSSELPPGDFINDYMLSATLSLNYIDSDGNAQSVDIDGDSTDSEVTAGCATYASSSQPQAGEVSLELSWTGADQPITLTTEISYLNPKTLVANIGALTEGAIDSPAGRAIIGEGTVVADIDPDDKNDDGTGTVRQDNDLLLVDQKDLEDGSTGEKKVYLTLEEACVSDTDGIYTCTDFVTVSGRVYLDTDDVRANFTDEDGQNIFIKASDASYCRLWKENPDPSDANFDASDISNPYTTLDGNYDFLAYTCYLGGGWYGNIGLVLADGVSDSDKLCMGDPNINAGDTRVAAGLRRAYRGMLADSTLSTGYSSIGIQDAASVTEQDFVLTYARGRETDDEACAEDGGALVLLEDSKYTREEVVAKIVADDDSPSGNKGDLFSGNPTDFVCLNEIIVDGVPLIDGGSYSEDIDGETEVYKIINGNREYIDLAGNVRATRTVPETCPYDPTGDEAWFYNIEVAVSFPTGASVDDQDLVISTASRRPRDSELCDYQARDASGDSLLLTYYCQVFDEGNGWSGQIYLNTNDTVYDCSVRLNEAGESSLVFSNLFGPRYGEVDTGDIDIQCVE